MRAFAVLAAVALGAACGKFPQVAGENAAVAADSSTDVAEFDTATDAATADSAATDVAADVLICTAPTPIKLATGQCVACTNDIHCAASQAGKKCNLASNVCEAAPDTS